MYLLLNKNLNINRKLLHINIKYKNTYIQFINKYKYTIIIYYFSPNTDFDYNCTNILAIFLNVPL